MSAINAAAAAGAARTAPRARSVSRRTRASLPSNARVRARARCVRDAARERIGRTRAVRPPRRAPARERRVPGRVRGLRRRLRSAPGSTRDVIDRDAAMSDDDDDDVDRRPAAPGSLQRMRREATPWYRRIGSNAWCAIALAVAVLVWNLPQALVGGGFFHALASYIPALAPIAHAIGKFAHLGVGFNPRRRGVHNRHVQDRRALRHHRTPDAVQHITPGNPGGAQQAGVQRPAAGVHVHESRGDVKRHAAHAVPRRAARLSRAVRRPRRGVRGADDVGVLRDPGGGVADVVSRVARGERGRADREESRGYRPTPPSPRNPAPGIPAAVLKPYKGGDTRGVRCAGR